MLVFIALAHPKTDSLNAALCRSLVQGLGEAGHVADIADLYAESFDPCLGGAELDALGSRSPLADVARYQGRIMAAEALAFVFPIWWFGPPAILKGFIDRVFEENFAFRFQSGDRVLGLLPHKCALIINTAGAGAGVYKLFGFGKPLKKTFDDWTLKICGIRRVEHPTFYDVVGTDDGTRKDYLVQARRLGREFFGKPGSLC